MEDDSGHRRLELHNQEGMNASVAVIVEDA